MGIRRIAREAALSYLYQYETLPQSRTAEPSVFFDHFFSHCSDARSFYLQLVQAYYSQSERIDSLIAEASKNWKLKRLARTDRAVLRMATAELLGPTETPSRVVLDEAVELAKRFGSGDSGGFVNGVLDAIWRKLEVPKTNENADSTSEEPNSIRA